MAGDDPKEALFLCALQNAVKHGGVPQAGAVIGMVMGAHPELLDWPGTIPENTSFCAHSRTP